MSQVVGESGSASAFPTPRARLVQEVNEPELVKLHHESLLHVSRPRLQQIHVLASPVPHTFAIESKIQPLFPRQLRLSLEALTASRPHDLSDPMQSLAHLLPPLPLWALVTVEAHLRHLARHLNADSPRPLRSRHHSRPEVPTTSSRKRSH